MIDTCPTIWCLSIWGLRPKRRLYERDDKESVRGSVHVFAGNFQVIGLAQSAISYNTPFDFPIHHVTDNDKVESCAFTQHLEDPALPV